MTERFEEFGYPQNQQIINCLEEEINSALGINTWNKITNKNCPNGNMNDSQLSVATQMLVCNFNRISDKKTAKQVFSNVKHALKHSDFVWAREKFLQYNNIDQFADAILQDSMNHLRNCLESKELFFGQPITNEAFEYVQSIKDLFYGIRTDNQITATAIPFMVKDYLEAKDNRMKRYHACHCQFARESILSEKTVSKTMCYCSLGHTKVFWEAALDTKLEGDVLMSALGGDTSCRFVIYLPDEIIKQYT